MHRSRERLALDTWHSVKVTRTGRDGRMKVDNQQEVIGMAKGAYTQLTLTLDLFVGGHRNFDEIAKTANVRDSLKGCVQKVKGSVHRILILNIHTDGYRFMFHVRFNFIRKIRIRRIVS